MTLTQAYILLGVAIAGEIISTGTLKATEGFTKWMPSLICILAITICMYTMSHVMKILPIGITYATWSGVGIVALSLIGVFKYKQIPNIPTLVGLLLIIIGVVIVNTMNSNQ
jgi:small multidrug resistance pump|tara:strand:- start:83 stop:418 length:336 start_codon:yes stop_codon:yes gene_type:complete